MAALVASSNVGGNGGIVVGMRHNVVCGCGKNATRFPRKATLTNNTNSHVG